MQIPFARGILSCLGFAFLTSCYTPPQFEAIQENHQKPLISRVSIPVVEQKLPELREGFPNKTYSNNSDQTTECIPEETRVTLKDILNGRKIVDLTIIGEYIPDPKNPVPPILMLDESIYRQLITPSKENINPHRYLNPRTDPINL